MSSTLTPAATPLARQARERFVAHMEGVIVSGKGYRWMSVKRGAPRHCHRLVARAGRGAAAHGTNMLKHATSIVWDVHDGAAGALAAMAIAITTQAYEAIWAMLPDGATPRPGPDGLMRIWLEREFVDRLAAMRGPGESYSDVILRLAKEEK